MGLREVGGGGERVFGGYDTHTNHSTLVGPDARWELDLGLEMSYPCFIFFCIRIPNVEQKHGYEY